MNVARVGLLARLDLAPLDLGPMVGPRNGPNRKSNDWTYWALERDPSGPPEIK